MTLPNFPIVRKFRDHVLRYIRKEGMCSFWEISTLAAKFFNVEDGDESSDLILNELTSDDMIKNLGSYYHLCDAGKAYLAALEVMES